MDIIARALDKKTKSFKQLGNNAISVTRFSFITKVLPEINRYYLTEKIDGERAFLIINENKAELILADRSIKLPFAVSGEYIFDCEYTGKIFIFDVITFRGEQVWRKPFAERYAMMKKFKLSDVIIKKYYQLTMKNYHSIISKLASSNEYKIDGLIFTSSDKDYKETKNIKWKYPQDNTIDFLAIKENSDYLLFVGIDRMMFRRFNLTLPSNYKQLLEGIKLNESYFPVPFYNSLKEAHQFKTNKDIHERIVELSLVNDKWELKRLRKDRQIELETGRYYGNNYKVAELTLQSMLNPLTLSDLCTPLSILMKDIYFQKEDPAYKPIRRFHNYIKRTLISRFKSKKVLDLGSGRGGDIAKYAYSGYKEVYMIEKNINNIDELIERKYEIIGKMFIKESGCNLRVIHLDLTRKDNIKVVQHEVPNLEKVPVIFCNFALHYMLDGKENAQNLARFILKYIAVGGYFIFTVFDSNRIKDWETDKYKINIINTGDKPFSGKLRVLLPFSNEAYEEPIVKLSEVDSLLKPLVRIEERNFEVFLREYKTREELTPEDVQFTKLYKYVVYKNI